MKTLAARSFAKINLELRILGRREDGYHEIKTVLQSIDLHDEMTFEEARTISLEVTGVPGVPADETNLALRAARLLAARHPGRGARIRLRKRIPAGAGLGGGSSNAAVTLMALDRLWGLDADPGLLYALARSIGSDVPFFLYRGTCLGLGRGDEIAPMPDTAALSVVLLCPEKPLPTAEVYGRLSLPLTSKPILSSIKGFFPGTPTRETTHPVRAPASDVFPDPVNDLEPTAFGMMPELARLKERLLASGARVAAMSGSGSAVFGLYSGTRDPAELAAEAATDEAAVMACRTLTREAYRIQLFERSRT